MVELICKQNNGVEAKCMKNKWFENERLINALIFMIGLVLVFIGIMFNETLGEQWSTVIISVGASVVASAVVSYITSIYLFKKKRLKEITDIWGLRSITKNRSEMNREVDKRLKDANKCLDVMAYGLKSFRESTNELIKDKIQDGIKIRILTVNPDSKYLSYRDLMENKMSGSTSHDIRKLADWIKEFSSDSIEIRYCDFLPTELYFRIDGCLYVGPYEIGRESQRTITYEFISGTKGFEYYTDYFDALWNNSKHVK